jgi:hypothetical protein
MAIAVDNTSNGTDANAASLTVAHTCTGTETNGILIVTIQVTDSSSSDRVISTVTHNNEACTHLPGADSDDDTDGLRTEIWYRANPTTGGTPNIVVTPGGTCTDLSLGAISLTGVNSTNFFVTADSYAEGNSDTGKGGNSAGDGFGQAFTGDGNVLTGCSFYCAKFAAADEGTVTAYLYAHTGTFGSTSKPANGASPLATSTNTLDISTLPLSSGTPALVQFNFDGTYTLTSGTKYIIAVKVSTLPAGDIFYLYTDR